jgi:hypothetical protein
MGHQRAVVVFKFARKMFLYVNCYLGHCHHGMKLPQAAASRDPFRYGRENIYECTNSLQGVGSKGQQLLTAIAFDSSVGMATYYGLDGRCSIPTRAETFFCSP